MYKILFSKQAKKTFAKLSPEIFTQIFNVIATLRINPRPHGYKKLVDREGYRVRSGDYRIIYTIDDTLEQILILNISPRKDAYKK